MIITNNLRFIPKVVRIILIKLLLPKKKLQGKILFFGEISEIRKLHDGSIDDEYFHSVKHELNTKKIKYSEIKLSNSNKFYFLNNKKKYNLIESFFSLFDLIRMFSVSNTKEILNYNRYDKAINKYELALYYLMFKRLFKKNPQIQKIAFVQSYGIRYAAVLAAKNCNVKSIELQHGTITKDHPGYFVPKKFAINYVPPTDTILYSEYEYSIMKNDIAFGKSNLKILGCPRYDFLKHYDFDKNKFLRKYHADKYKIIFWATQTHDPVMMNSGESDYNAECVFSTLKKMPEWFLIIKFHPGEDYNSSKEFYMKYINKYNITNYVILKFNDELTYDCVLASDAVLMKTSTVGIESLLMGIPVINFGMKKSWSLELFEDFSANLIVRKPSDLIKYLDCLKSSEYHAKFKKAQKEYEKKHYAYCGNSSIKIANFLISETFKN
ncbi:hypothetical protein JXM83_03105 [Candidatus Woesearchaeota archaeon]|nr:hypothetical protein [Candidatus Woesearchaeota archaeon]